MICLHLHSSLSNMIQNSKSGECRHLVAQLTHVHGSTEW